MNELRLVIADDHDLFRTGLRNLLADQGLEIAGEASTGAEARQRAPMVERGETSTRCPPTMIDDAMASAFDPTTCCVRPGTIGRNVGMITPEVLA